MVDPKTNKINLLKYCSSFVYFIKREKLQFDIQKEVFIMCASLNDCLKVFYYKFFATIHGKANVNSFFTCIYLIHINYLFALCNAIWWAWVFFIVLCIIIHPISQCSNKFVDKDRAQLLLKFIVWTWTMMVLSIDSHSFVFGTNPKIQVTFNSKSISKKFESYKLFHPRFRLNNIKLRKYFDIFSVTSRKFQFFHRFTHICQRMAKKFKNED